MKMIERASLCISVQDIGSRRLKTSQDMDFESRIRLSTKDGFDSKDSYLNQTDS